MYGTLKTPLAGIALTVSLGTPVLVLAQTAEAINPGLKQTAPIPSTCLPGWKWSTTGSGIAHCVMNDPECPGTTELIHDALGNPSCFVPVVVQQDRYTGCTGGKIGSRYQIRTITTHANGTTTTSAWKTIDSDCTSPPVPPPPTSPPPANPPPVNPPPVNPPPVNPPPVNPPPVDPPPVNPPPAGDPVPGPQPPASCPAPSFYCDVQGVGGGGSIVRYGEAVYGAPPSCTRTKIQHGSERYGSNDPDNNKCPPGY